MFDVFFFFQAEDGIRDHCVTGVQTCALPIPSIVVSLWQVPDAPTADLMAEFYNQLSQGQDKAQIGRASCRERV